MRPTLFALLLPAALCLASTAAASWPPQADDFDKSAGELGAKLGARLSGEAKQLESRFEQLRRTLGRQQQQLPRPPPPRPQPARKSAEVPDDSYLLMRDRAGSHVFKMHNGRAVDAQLGASRSFRVQEGVFVVKICACTSGGGTSGDGSSGGHPACVMRFKPAFYGVLTAACLLAIALAATVAATVVRRRRAAAVTAAAVAARPLLAGSFGGLSVQCDPVMYDGVYGHKIQKVSI